MKTTSTLEKKKFNRRAFVSLCMMLAACFLPVSGIMNHKLQLAGMTEARHFWMSVHNMASLLFMIFAVLHVRYNWHTLIKYVRNIPSFSMRKETIAAFALVLGIIGLFSLHALHGS